MIDCQPILPLGEPQQTKFFSGHVSDCGEDGCWRGGDGGQGPQDDADPPDGAPGLSSAVLQSWSHWPVACDAHRGQEEDARVHVHHGHREDDLTHGVSKRPAEVQRRVHGPERQSQNKLKICHGQIEDEKVYFGCASLLFHANKEDDQQVANQTYDANHRVGDGDQAPQHRTPIGAHINVFQAFKALSITDGSVDYTTLITVSHCIQRFHNFIVAHS